MTTTNKDFRVKNGLIVEGNSATVNGNQVITSADAANFALLNAANTFTGGVQQITTASAATKGLIIQGAASQTANLQEWQDSAGTVLARITSTGTISGTNGLSATGGSITGINSQANSIGSAISGVNWAVTAGGATLIPIVAKGAASQTANLQEWQDSTGAIVAAMWSSGTFSTAGRVSIGNGSSGAKLDVLIASSTQLGLVVKGFISQTANLQEWQDSAGTVLAKVASSGALSIAAATANLALGGTIGGVQYLNSIIFDSGNSTNPVHRIRWTGGGSGNPNWEIGTNTGLQTNKNWFVRYTEASPNVRDYIPLRIQGTNGTTILSAFSGQTANLQEWQNSSGGVDTAVTSTGRLSVRTTLADAGLNVGAPSAATVAAIIRGFTSQSANLQQWQDNGGTVIARLTASGSFLSAARVSAGSSTVATANINSYIPSASLVGILVQGAASQTANLQEWQNSAGTILTRVSSGGAVVTSGVGVFGSQSNAPNAQLFVLANSLVYPTFVAKAIASQTANLTEWQDTSGGALSYVGPTGVLTLNNGNSTPPATYSLIVKRTSFFDTGATASVGIIVRARASQTANLQEWQNSAGTILAGANALAQSFTGSTTPILVATGGATTAASGDGTTATITTTSAHGLAVGDLVTIAGVTPTGYNATAILTAVASTTISYLNATTGAQTIAGTVSAPAQASVTARSAGSVGLVVKPASGQLSNMTEWYNSSGVLISWVRRDGLIAGQIQSPTLIGATIAKPNSATGIPIVVQGFASQTANLQEWQNSSGTVITRVRPDGQIGVGSTLITSTNFFVNNTFSTTHVVATIRGAVSQTANLTEWQDSAGIVKAKINSFGDLTAPALIATYSTSIVSGGVSIVPLTVKGFASQTANLTEWQDSAGTVLAKIQSNGVIDTSQYLNMSTSGNAGIAVGGSYRIRMTGGNTRVQSGSGIVTTLTVEGVASQTANLQEWQNSAGTVLVKIAADGRTTFPGSYLDIHSSGNLTVRGSDAWSANASALIGTGYAGGIGLIIKGAASQTADLQQWQDSAGTVLTRINSAGNVYTSGYLTAGVQSPTGTLTVVSKGVSVPVAVIKGAASQTANLTEWQDSSGTILSAVDKAGNLTKGDGDQLVLAGQIYG